MRVRETIDWGIDLGMTNSSIAVFDGRDMRIIKNNISDEVTPSAIYEKRIGNNVSKLIGKTAKNKLTDGCEHVALEFKRNIGLKDWYFEFPSTGRKATAVDLSAEILGELINSVKQREKEDVYSALITVPNAFLQPTYEATKKAGEIAGLKYVEILEEPIAAAHAYGFEANSTRKTIWLAYDLGGGTFDAALVKMEDGVLNVFDHEGISHLGGKDLDKAIIDEYLIPNLATTKIKNSVIPWKSTSWWQLKMAAEEAKIHLSTFGVNDSTIDTKIDNIDFVYTLTKNQLDKLEANIFSPTIEKCRELLSRNKFNLQDIEKVILIGGPTLSLHLRKMINEGLQIPIDFSVDPLTAVARGAALCAKGRRIPDDIFKKVRTTVHGVKDIPLNAVLNYPPTTTEDEIMITGKIESKKDDLKVTSDWGIEIMRVDEAGNTVWTSGRVTIPEHGSFARTIPLIEGDNLFRFVVTGGDGQIVEADKDYFSIVKSRIESGKSLLPRGIGIADDHGDVIWFFKKGDPLPAEKVDILKTTKYLSKGSKGESLKFPVVEGNENKAYLNRLIDTLKIEAEKVTSNIPEGSNVEVTIKIDKSRTIEVKAFFEDHDVDEKAIMEHRIDIDLAKLGIDINEVKDALSKLKQIKDMDPEVNKIIEEVDQSKVVERLETLSAQASKETPEPATKAQEKILELRKKIEPIIESGNRLLKWKAHKEWCDKNIQAARNIVRSIEEMEENIIDGKWKKCKDEKLELVFNEYQQAVDNKDFKKTEEIAYYTLPALFKSADDDGVEVWYKTNEGKKIRIKLSALVGGDIIERGTSEGISTTAGPDSNVKK